MFKFINRHWRRRYERFYARHRWHLAIDVTLILIILTLAASSVFLYFYQPNFSRQSFPVPVVKPTVDFSNPPLELFFSLPDASPRLTDGLDLKITFRNNGSTELKDIKVTLFSADNNYSVSRLAGESDQGVKVSGRQAVISAIKPGESGEALIKAYVTAKNNAVRTVSLQARLEYDLAGQPVEETIALDRWLLPADFKIKSAAYYTSPQGDQLGLGPLPPAVGLPTNYWIFWEANSVGDLKDLVISARLPKGVELTDNYSLLSGDFSYNLDSRQVIWRVPEVESQSDSYHLNFEVQLLPVADQVSRMLPLVTGIRYRAVDSLTGEAVSGDSEDLDTGLADDKFNEGRGEVVAQ